MKALSRRLRDLQNDARLPNFNNWKHMVSSIIVDVRELENLIACGVDPTGLDEREQEICRQCVEELDQPLMSNGGSMYIEQGWKFHSADFSLNAAGSRDTGTVKLVRSPHDRALWHGMPDDLKEDDDGPEIYVHGRGRNLEEAIVNANLAASHAKPIPDLGE